MLSRFFCGEGFPDWAVSFSKFKFPFPIKMDMEFDEHNIPLMKDCLKKNFATYYMSTDVSKTFEDFF